MSYRTAPTLATWILKLFCSSPEHEPVIGDLNEQYQCGQTSLWYWRQVIGIVIFGNYRKAGRRVVVTAGKIPIQNLFWLVLGIAVISATLLSDVWPLFVITIVAGVFVGIFRFGRGAPPIDPNRRVLSGPGVARIDSSHISVSGGLGAGLLILFLMSAALYDVKAIRLMAMPGLLAGLIFAVALRLWRREHVPAPRVMPLGLIDKVDNRRSKS